MLVGEVLQFCLPSSFTIKRQSVVKMSVKQRQELLKRSWTQIADQYERCSSGTSLIGTELSIGRPFKTLVLIVYHAMASLQALGTPLHAMDTAYTAALLSTKVASWPDFGASMWSRYHVNSVTAELLATWLLYDHPPVHYI